MNEIDESRLVGLGYAAIKYGAWLIGLIVVLFFLSAIFSLYTIAVHRPWGQPSSALERG